MNFLKGFFLNHFGNVNGSFQHSMKKVGFSFATYTAYVVPHFLLAFRVIDGGQWLDFFKIIVPATLSIYAAGKWIDGKNANGHAEKSPE